MGLPKGREPQGDGVPILVVRVKAAQWKRPCNRLTRESGKAVHTEYLRFVQVGRSVTGNLMSYPGGTRDANSRNGIEHHSSS